MELGARCAQETRQASSSGTQQALRSCQPTACFCVSSRRHLRLSSRRRQSKTACAKDALSAHAAELAAEDQQKIPSLRPISRFAAPGGVAHDVLAAGFPLAVGGAVAWLLLGSLEAAAAQLSSSDGPTYHPVAADVQNLAQNDEFWSNLARYGRYFVTVLLGTAYTAVKPLGGLLRNPVTAFAVAGAAVALYLFVNATLQGMLGVGQEPLQLLDY